MSNHQGPRAGSRAYIVLEHLFRRAHTSAHVSDVRRAAAPNLTTGEFNCTVVTSLARFGFVTELDGFITITPAGKRYMTPPVVETGPARLPVEGPYAAPKAPLSKRYITRTPVMRDGAFDYRDVPSLHGDQRLPYAPPRSVVSATRK